MVYQKDPRKLALILNPEAGKNLKEGARIAHLAHQAGLEVRLASTPAEITRCLFELAEEKDLLISGGDGTVAIVLTVYENLPRKPLLGVLPGGTTNLIARDLHSRGQEEVMRAVRNGFSKLVKRKIMKLDPPGVCGMFLGGGLITEGVKTFRYKRYLEGKKIGFWRAFWPFFLRAFRRKTSYPVMRVEQGQTCFIGPFWLFWATTLESLFGRLRPFSPCREIKAGALSQRATFWSLKALRKFLTERVFHQPKQGFFSFCGPKYLLYTRELALDGEIYYSPKGRFQLKVAGEVTFITW